MKQNDSIGRILDKAVDEGSLSFENANKLMNPSITQLSELIQASNLVTQRNFGNKIDMCAIYPAKIGQCSGDCAFCAQSAYHKCNIEPVNVANLDENEIVENAKRLEHLGVTRYSLVTSGEYLTDLEFKRIIEIFQKIQIATKIGLCASLGALTMERAKMLVAVGVSRYHHNIETSRSFFSKICSTHTYDDRIKTLSIARQSGLEICCGGIIAMGETPEQRIEMAFELKELNVDCIPINILNPIPGTRLEKQPLLSVDDIIRTIAVFRLILPDTPLRFAGGREQALGNDEYKGYTAGINSVIVGNYLTTSGKPFIEEMKNLKKLIQTDSIIK